MHAIVRHSTTPTYPIDIPLATAHLTERLADNPGLDVSWDDLCFGTVTPPPQKKTAADNLTRSTCSQQLCYIHPGPQYLYHSHRCHAHTSGVTVCGYYPSLSNATTCQKLALFLVLCETLPGRIGSASASSLIHIRSWTRQYANCNVM